ncbi:hypothetical protein Droror1_Dr00028111 [Drosera rotundifolia]
MPVPGYKVGVTIDLVTSFFGRAFFFSRSISYSPLCHCLIFGCLITLEIMYLLIVFLPLLSSVVAAILGRFLGSEGGINLGWAAMLIFLGIFFFRLLYKLFGRKKKGGRFLLIVMYFALTILISGFFLCLRANLLSYLSLFLHLCPYLLLYVSEGEIIPSAGASSDSEDSFEIQVLAEPWPVTPNLGFEASIKNRILAFCGK